MKFIPDIVIHIRMWLILLFNREKYLWKSYRIYEKYWWISYVYEKIMMEILCLWKIPMKILCLCDCSSMMFCSKLVCWLFCLHWISIEWFFSPISWSMCVVFGRVSQAHLRGWPTRVFCRVFTFIHRLDDGILWSWYFVRFFVESTMMMSLEAS